MLLYADEDFPLPAVLDLRHPTSGDLHREILLATVQFAAAQYGVESPAFLRIPWFDRKYGFEKLRLAFLVAPVSPFIVIAPIPISMRPAPTAVSRGWKSRKSVHWYCV